MIHRVFQKRAGFILKMICGILSSSALFTSPSLFASDLGDLEERAQEFILETKKIEIPGYPIAFNPSIIRWEGKLLLCFRVIPDRKKNFNSWLGLVWLDDEFNPVSEPQELVMRSPDSKIPCRAEDGRLIKIGDRLYLVYSDNAEAKISKGGFRVYVGEVKMDQGRFSLENIDCLTQYEGETKELREKNWVPFNYSDQLLLSYSIDPHLVFLPLFGNGECLTVSKATSEIDWNWGIVRGGTTALEDESGDYLAIFHSWKETESDHSGGKTAPHYFVGAYTFSRHPPFTVNRMSPTPIVAKGFYKGAEYKPYWKPSVIVFPAGLLIEGDWLWVTYGRQDHEMWVMKIDRRALLDSLVPVAQK